MRTLFLLLFVSLTHAVCAQFQGALFDSLSADYDAGRFEKCVSSRQALLLAYEAAQDSTTADVYFMIGNSYLNLGETDSAKALFEKESEIRKKYRTLNYPNYTNSLYNLIYVYNQLGEYQKAIIVGNELLESDRMNYGAQSKEYLLTVLYYVDVLIGQGKFLQAKGMIELQVKSLPPDHPVHAEVISKYADILSALGEYSKAESLFNQALNELFIRENPESYVATITQTNLATMLVDQGRYLEAEEIYAEALKKFKTQNTPESEIAYYSTLNNYGLVLLGLSRVEEATRVYTELLAYDSDSYGEEHPYYGISLNNAGYSFTNAGEFSKAKVYLEKSAEIQRKVNGESSYDYASNQNNLGKMFMLSGNPRQSLPYFTKAATIFEAAVGRKSIEYATVTFNHGTALMMLNQPEAKTYLTEALNIRKSFGSAHPKYGESLLKMAVYEWSQKNYKVSSSLFKQTFTNYFEQIGRYFPGLSENEKTSFYYRSLKPAFEIYNTYVIQRLQDEKSLAGDLYNLQLNTKGIIFYATNKVRNSILKSGDTTLLKKYETWYSTKEQISKLYSGGDVEPAKIDSLQKVANLLEKELTKKSATFNQVVAQKPVTWQQIQSLLKPGEAAIEIIRYRDYALDSGGRFTDLVKYIALILTKDSKKGPEVVELPNIQNRLEKKALNFYRNSMIYKLEDLSSYKVYWEPIADKIKGINKVIISPDGVFNQINLNSLKNPFTNQYLFDELNIEIRTNTKDLLADKKEGSTFQKKSSCLIGYPQFTLNSESKNTRRQAGMRALRGDRSSILRYLRSGDQIASLPATKTEIESISSIFKNASIPHNRYLSTEAQEQIIKSTSNPSVMHIATHGFFLDDPEDLDYNQTKFIDNPLLRSGIILAGAEDYLKTGELTATEEQDGILTAQEAMNLTLDETDLVVLSACETGLGTVKNGEGVYGLQRALRIAGARSLIMSLWSVDDEATQYLMTSFYEAWAETGNKFQAFQQAQQKVKDKYKEPFYWAAFQLIGE